MVKNFYFQHSGSGPLCVFREILSADHFTELHSAANASWRIGFRSNGNGLPGRPDPPTAAPPVDDDRQPTTPHGGAGATAFAAFPVVGRRLNKCYQFIKSDGTPPFVDSEKGLDIAGGGGTKASMLENLNLERWNPWPNGRRSRAVRRRN